MFIYITKGRTLKILKSQGCFSKSVRITEIFRMKSRTAVVLKKEIKLVFDIL